MPSSRFALFPLVLPLYLSLLARFLSVVPTGVLPAKKEGAPKAPPRPPSLFRPYGVYRFLLSNVVEVIVDGPGVVVRLAALGHAVVAGRQVGADHVQVELLVDLPAEAGLDHRAEVLGVVVADGADVRGLLGRAD